jgi:hypothetical protein
MIRRQFPLARNYPVAGPYPSHALARSCYGELSPRPETTAMGAERSVTDLATYVRSPPRAVIAPFG